MPIVKPEQPHGALGEHNARLHTRSVGSLEARRTIIQPPIVSVPTKPARIVRKLAAEKLTHNRKTK